MLAALLAAQARAATGYVFDAVSKKPLAAAIVTINGQAGITNKDGLFQFPDGIDSIQVRASGYTRQQVQLQSNQLKQLRKTPNGSLQVEGGFLEIPMQRLKVKAVYLSIATLSDAAALEQFMSLVEASDLNAVVFDVKHDNGQVSLDTHADTMNQLIQRLRNTGRYAIARVAVFKDEASVVSHPEWGLKGTKAQTVRDNDGLRWTDPANSEVVNYNLRVVSRAAALGVDEVQLDYIRFPTVADAPETDAAYRRKWIVEFVSQARKMLTPWNVYLSADLYAYSAWDSGDTRIGQALEDWGPLVDYICLMVYPSSFKQGTLGLESPWDNPAKIVSETLERAKARSVGDPLKLRPWLQAFDDYAFDRRRVEWGAVSAQIRATELSGASGWMLWNTRSKYIVEGVRGPRRRADEYAARIQSLVKGEIDAGRLRGAVIAVGSSTDILFQKAYGQRWSGRDEPMTTDTVFDLASLTKPIVAGMLTMQLVEQGKLALNMPVHWVWSEFAQQGKSEITVRQLLTHTSGLRADLDLREPWEGYRTAVQMIEQTRPSRPDGEVHYSDVNFEALGEVIQRVSGKSLDVLAREQVFNPLGMIDTGFNPDSNFFPRVAATQRIPSGPLWGQVHDATARRMGGISGHAGLFSTVGDLTKFAQMLLRGGTYLNGKGRVLDKATVNLMFKRHPGPNPLARTRALAWDVGGQYGYSAFPAGSVGHLGFTGTMLWLHPSQDLFVIALTARTWPDGKGDAQPLRRGLLELLDP